MLPRVSRPERAKVELRTRLVPNLERTMEDARMALRTRIASLLALSTGALLAQTAGPAQAQPNPEGDAPIGVLLAVGDIAQCGKSESQQHDEAVAEIVAQEIERAEAEGLPLRLLLLGDLAYGDGSREQFDQCFDPAWGRFKDVSMPVPGNHKYHQPEATPYFRYFRKAPLMADGEPLVASEGARAGFYTVRFPEPEGGPWLLLGLNSGEEGEVERPGWLRNVLEENQAAGAGGARCVLAFSHDFLFSSGAHGHGYEKSDPAAPLEPGDGMRRAFDLLDRLGASVLLSGHDHHFEQFAPQDAKGNADPEGLRSFIVGTGGGDAYLEEVGFTYEEQAANQEFIDGSHFGVLRIELFADRYTWSFVREGGEVVEPEPHEAECQEL